MIHIYYSLSATMYFYFTPCEIKYYYYSHFTDEETEP